MPSDNLDGDNPCVSLNVSTGKSDIAHIRCPISFSPPQTSTHTPVPSKSVCKKHGIKTNVQITSKVYIDVAIAITRNLELAKMLEWMLVHYRM